MISTTALLLFSRSAEAENSCKTIFLSAKKNKKATAALIDYATELVSSTGLSWYKTSELSQKGNDFGQNIESAISAVFNRGHKKVIVIGNDCPELTPLILQQAIQQLNISDAVIGPSVKGGIYLLGLSAELFKKNVLQNVPWCSSLVFSKLAENLLCLNARYNSLTTLNDINGAFDVLLLLNKTKNRSSLSRLLIDLYKSAILNLPLPFCTLNYWVPLPVVHRRGPPATYL